MIHRFGLRDIRLLKQLQARGVIFDIRRQLLQPRTPLVSALLGLFSHEGLGSINYIYSPSAGEGSSTGFISAYPRRHLPYWDLSFMAPALDASPQAFNIWSRLLTHISICGARRGITRIYARTAEDPEVEDILHQAGYSVVAHSEIFVLVNRPSPVLMPRGLHRLEPRDMPALYQLYHEVVPPLAQQAEGTVPHWASIKKHRLSLWKSHEYIWSDKNRINAYLGLCETKNANWLEVVVRPEYRAEILPLIKFVLSQLEALDTVPVYCQVPDYSIGISWILRALGFESFANQVTMVEHTLARVPLASRVVATGLEAGIEIGVNARPVFRYQARQQKSVSGRSQMKRL